MNALIVVPTTTWYLLLSAVLFTIGTVGVLVRRNPLVMFMCIELMLNAVNLTFVTLGRRLNDIDGQAIVFFVLVVAALSYSHITMSMLFLAVCIDEEKVSSRLGNVRRQISERKNAELYHLQPNKLLAVER